MNSTLIIKNNTFLDILQSDDLHISEFVSIIDLLKDLSYVISLSPDVEYLENIFECLHRRAKRNEDFKIINKVFEKMFVFLNQLDYEDYLDEIKKLADIESCSFFEVLCGDEHFNNDIRLLSFKFDELKGLRNISSFDDLKLVLLLFCNSINEIESFAHEIQRILSEILFDADIVSSMKKLSDGFELRKQEIIYHLYCICKEIPEILKQNYKTYQDIGDNMSIPCSPERDRDTVERELKKFINGTKVNCELHTKMKRISSNKPDRIYFCPYLPEGTGIDRMGKIYIYKITQHV